MADRNLLQHPDSKSDVAKPCSTEHAHGFTGDTGQYADQEAHLHGGSHKEKHLGSLRQRLSRCAEAEGTLPKHADDDITLPNTWVQEGPLHGGSHHGRATRKTSSIY